MGKRIEISGDTLILGRSPDADVIVDRVSISREHAKIMRAEEDGEECFVVVDLKSRNGVYVNHVPATTERLCNGDKVLLGDVLFMFVVEDDAEERFHTGVHRRIHYHHLTGLLTVETFMERLETELANTRPGGCMTLAMTDLDGLKRVNDSYGHIAGSIVLSQMGDLIRDALRPQDYAGLYGGDEAIILFPDTRIQDAIALAEDVRRTIEARAFEYKGESFRVTISQGLAEWPKHGSTSRQLVDAADTALYAAKTSGRNRICLATEALGG